MRTRGLVTVGGLLVLAALGLTAVWAGPFLSVDPLVQVSGTSPFAGCVADNVAGQPGTNFLHSEVEPWVAVDPRNASHIVGGWQQDRWSNGGSRGLGFGASFDGGATWTTGFVPKISLCSGGTALNGGDFKRATDPWVTIAANGDVYFFSLSLDIETPAKGSGGFGKNALFVSKSVDGGLTWGDPIKIIEDTDPRFLNDKNSITADPVDPSLVYAVWDRLQLPVGTVINPEHVIGFGFKGPAMFSRTTDAGQSWEPAHSIFAPGANQQTIGNQIVVLPDGTLVNFFNLIRNQPPRFEMSLALVRSTDKGVTWTHGQAIQAAQMLSRAVFDPQLTGVRDPDTNRRVRTGDIIPEVAVDPASGNLYAVWQDSRFSGFVRDEVAFAMSTDGGFNWSTPIKINQTPSNILSGDRQAFTPMVRVSSDGTIGVTYYDFRNNTPCPIVDGTPDCTGIPLSTDYFIVHCHQSVTVSCADAAHWGDELRLTNVSFDMRAAPVARGFFVGDYEGLGSGGTKFMALFSQSHPGDRASIFFRRVGP